MPSLVPESQLPSDYIWDAPYLEVPMTAIPFRQTPYYEILKPDLAGLEGTSAEVIRHAREFAAWMESIPEAQLDHA